MKNICFILLLIIYSNYESICKEELFNDDIVDIGTFNIAWLGDGEEDRVNRTENDYENISLIIKQSGVDILALQEIENEEALLRVLKYLPDWNYIIGINGKQQNLAYLYKKGIKVKKSEEYLPLIVKKDRTRPGLIAYLEIGNFDFIIMNIHLKSTSRYDNTKEKKLESYNLRRRQSEVIKQWSDSILINNIDKDIIILGDFNDHPDRKLDNLKPLKNMNMEFITADITSCKDPNWDSIDHIVLTHSVTKRLIPFSQRMFNHYFSLQEFNSKKISDHCMVIFSVDINKKDND